MKTIRLSSVSVAVFTALATLSLTNDALGQTPEQTSSSPIATVESETISPELTEGAVNASTSVEKEKREDLSHAAHLPAAFSENIFPDPVGLTNNPPTGFSALPVLWSSDYLETTLEETREQSEKALTQTAPELGENAAQPKRQERLGDRPLEPQLSPLEESDSELLKGRSLNAQQPPSQEEPRVLIAELAVIGVEGELQDEVFRVITTEPGRTTTRTQLQEDINAIFATGFFSNVQAIPEDTPLGVRITFVVEPNPVLRQVNIQANASADVPSVLEARVIEDIFSPQYGSILNFQELQEGIEELNQWYQDNGYVLAQVIDAPQIGADGIVTLVVAEGVIEDIQVRFLNEEGEATDEEGQPIEGKTREFIITRELQLESGQVFNRARVEADLQRVFGLGIFEDVQLSLNPGTDPRQVVVVINVQERNTGSIAAGAGISSASGVFGSISYQEQNLGGNNQDLRAELQLGTREVLFDLSFTDPWIAGDPFRTSYTANLFRRRSISLVFDGDDDDIELPNGDRPRVLRLGGGVRFSRPLGEDLLNPDWRASLGLQYQRVSIRDSDGDLEPRSEDGERLAFNSDGQDDLFLTQLGLVQDRRNDPQQPTEGTLTRFSIEQSIPIGKGTIFLNRVRASHSFYIPVSFTNFSEGPQALAFNFQAGSAIGDLPPYEAFVVGGSNSVRGFSEGELGSGRYFVQGTVEYRFPVISVVSGALFVDAGTTLGSGSSVTGDPAGRRDLPGSGAAVGLGVRIRSPLGPIRVDFGVNTEGDSRIHFGIGERF